MLQYVVDFSKKNYHDAAPDDEQMDSIMIKATKILTEKLNDKERERWENGGALSEEEEEEDDDYFDEEKN